MGAAAIFPRPRAAAKTLIPLAVALLILVSVSASIFIPSEIAGPTLKDRFPQLTDAGIDIASGEHVLRVKEQESLLVLTNVTLPGAITDLRIIAPSDGAIRTDVAVVRGADGARGHVRLAKHGHVDAVFHCADYTDGCVSGWEATDVPFVDHGGYIEFSATRFSAWGAGTLPWSPACDYNATQVGPFDLAYNSEGRGSACLYNSTLLFIRSPVSQDFGSGEWFKTSVSDVIFDNISETFPQTLEELNGRLIFDYYRPYRDDDNATCPSQSALVQDWIFYSDQNALTYTNGSWHANGYRLNGTYTGCGTWGTFNETVMAFEDQGLGSTSRLESVAFELSNIYITNIRVQGQGGVIDVWP